MKIWMPIFIILFLIGYSPVAQPLEGVITYEQTEDWARIYGKLDFLSQEEKDRIKISWGSYSIGKTDMKLVFDAGKSLYTYASDYRKSDDGRYSSKQLEYVIYRDFDNNVRKDWLETLGRIYHVEDTITVPKWKIMNKIKDIQGHVCMMAVAEDTLKGQQITAWFADDLPVSVGPGMYYGLPGAILELDINDGDITIVAKEIQLGPVGDALTPKTKRKGRKVNGKTLDELTYKHIKDSMKSRRSPYIAMPFL